jgi:type I restriction enzyme S subunit
MGAIKRLNRYEDGVVTTLYICFELTDERATDSDFYEQYFESGQLNKGLMQIAHEGGRAHGLLNVKPSDFFSLKVLKPPRDEQKAIANLLVTADRELQAQKNRLERLRTEKKALMQQLLTGRRRVKLETEAA